MLSSKEPYKLMLIFAFPNCNQTMIEDFRTMLDMLASTVSNGTHDERAST